MAKDKEEEIDDNDDEKPTKSKKFLIIAIVAVLLIIGGGAAAYFLVFAKGDDKKKDDAKVEETAEAEGEHAEEGGDAKKKDAKPSGPVYFDMPEFLVNLSTASKQVSFLKMKITLELKDKKDIKAVENFMPRITDSFNTYLRELRPSDLSGSAGMYRLREELTLRINQTIAPAQVENILFKEVIVQ